MKELWRTLNLFQQGSIIIAFIGLAGGLITAICKSPEFPVFTWLSGMGLGIFIGLAVQEKK